MKKNRLRLLYGAAFPVLMTVETLIALYVHDRVIRPYVGDLLVVFVIYCFIRIFVPVKGRLMPLYVFLFAAFVETLQYFDPVTVLGLSGSRLARVVIGSVFDVKDLACYAAGCLLLALWEWKAGCFLRARAGEKEKGK